METTRQISIQNFIKFGLKRNQPQKKYSVSDVLNQKNYISQVKQKHCKYFLCASIFCL